MKIRFRTMSGALALTVMLLFSAVAFGHTATASAGNAKAGAAETRNERWKKRHHRRHMRRVYRRERREMKREKNENR